MSSSPARTALTITSLIVGGILALIAIGLLIGGLTLATLHGTQRDEDGFYTSSTERLVTTTHALTTEEIDFGSSIAPDSRIWEPDLATVRITTESDDTGVFVGIGPADAVESYLSSVRHEEITNVETDNGFSYETTTKPGTDTPGAPGDQTFWVASAAGTGESTLEWEVSQGRWIVALMNEDGSTAVSHRVQVGVKSDLAVPIIVGLLGIGLLLALGALGLLIAGIRGINGRADHAHAEGAVAPGPAAGSEGALKTPAVASALPAGAYPAALSAELDPGLSRWLWLVKWILAIPHFIVLVFLWIAFWLATVIAFFAILFTRRYPRGLFDFNVGVMRWTWRVAFYATSAIGTDRYPPFSLESTDYPADFTVEYPGELSRGLVLVKWWLLAIPHYLVIAAFGGGLQWPAFGFFGAFEGDSPGGFPGGPLSLVAILVLIAGGSLLFTNRYPAGIFELVMGVNRWVFRVHSYVALMTDRYPPFRLDMGADEPVVASPPTRPAPPLAATKRTAP